MTAVVPDRLGLVIELARQLGRKPSSNEIRDLLKCGRATANTLLDELDQVAPQPAPAGPPAASLPLPAATETATDQERATGSQVARGWPQMALPAVREQPATLPRRGWFRRPWWSYRPGGPTGGPVDPAAASAPPVHRGWLLVLALPAFVAVWGGWVGLGGLAGFGPVHLLPGILDHFTINLAVTLPAGMEVYAVIGLRVWLSSRTRSDRTRRFAARSTCLAMLIGCSGQVAYHVLARPTTGAPMFVTVCVACLPVVLLGMGAALFHMVGDDQRADGSTDGHHRRGEDANKEG